MLCHSLGHHSFVPTFTSPLLKTCVKNSLRDFPNSATRLCRLTKISGNEIMHERISEIISFLGVKSKEASDTAVE